MTTGRLSSFLAHATTRLRTSRDAPEHLNPVRPLATLSCRFTPDYSTPYQHTPCPLPPDNSLRPQPPTIPSDPNPLHYDNPIPLTSTQHDMSDRLPSTPTEGQLR